MIISRGQAKTHFGRVFCSISRQTTAATFAVARTLHMVKSTEMRSLFFGVHFSIMDHDRLFKELLTQFFREFIALFLPDVAVYLDPDTPIEFLDKEVFTDVTAGEKHEVDLIAKVRFRGQDAFFLIHVENQSSPQSWFPRRMFAYFARLHEKYDLPVYPVVIFSYDIPRRPEPYRYRIRFPGKNVLDFQYTVIQLNRLSWRRFVQQPNPVASALMAKMRMALRDRPKVKLECLRLLATLKLDPARSKLIGGFVESYLLLTADENRRYERELAKLAPQEKETTMEMVTSWEKEGMERLLLRMIQHRFGELTVSMKQRLDHLTAEQMDELGVALLDFTTPADLERWLSKTVLQ